MFVGDASNAHARVAVSRDLIPWFASPQAGYWEKEAHAVSPRGQPSS